VTEPLRKRRNLAIARLLQTFLIGAALVAANVVTAPPAQAYTHLCGRFYGVSGNDPISYRYYNVTTAYYNAFNSAQGSWDASRATGFFRYEANNGDPQVEVHDASYSWGDWARASWSGCTFGYWSYD
jgi:hypothetical protein